MRKFLAPLIAMSSMFAVVACSNGGGGSAPTPSCPASTVFDASTNTCKTPTKPVCGPGQTYDPATNLCVATATPTPTVAEYYDYNRYYPNFPYQNGMGTGHLSITHTEGYKAFLREAMGICDRNLWGWTWGLDDCNTWIGGSFIITWRMDSSMVPVLQFTAYPPVNAFQFAFSIGIDNGGAALNPLTLPMQSHQQTTFNLINNSKGYEIRANGSAWNGGGLRLIQIQVHAGTLADNEAVYELYYPYNNQPVKVATGKFKRYSK